MAQPTWVEMQNVIDGVSGMKTDSTVRPSTSLRRNFSVPSTDLSRWTIAGVRIANSAASSARNSRDRSVIDDTSVTPIRYTHPKIWRAWKPR